MLELEYPFILQSGDSNDRLFLDQSFSSQEYFYLMRMTILTLRYKTHRDTNSNTFNLISMHSNTSLLHPCYSLQEKKKKNLLYCQKHPLPPRMTRTFMHFHELISGQNRQVSQFSINSLRQ